MSGAAPVRIVLTTLPDETAAAALVGALVEERLAACGNIVSAVRSIYRWQDRVHDDAEVLVLLKTVEASVAPLLARLEELHPYDVPEALALPVQAGSTAYLQWVAANADGGTPSQEQHG